MAAPTGNHVVEGGDHSFLVSKTPSGSGISAPRSKISGLPRLEAWSEHVSFQWRTHAPLPPPSMKERRPFVTRLHCFDEGLTMAAIWVTVTCSVTSQKTGAKKEII